MIYDVITAAIFLILITVYAYRGAARSIAGIISSLIAYAAAAPLGKLLSVWLYRQFVSPAINRAVVSAFDELAAGNVQSALDSVPGWLGGMISAAGLDMPDLTSSALGQSADAVCDTVNTAVQPIAVGLLSALSTAVLFLLLVVILRLLITKPLLHVFDFPGLRGVNRVLGGVIGFVNAFLLVSLIAYLLGLLMPAIGKETGWLNESTIYNSFIFSRFYSGNIFTALFGSVRLN